MPLSGVLVVDKPAGLTSAQVVAEVKRRARVDHAGHTGTLDPLATGVLPVCLGEATKLTPWLTADDKAYEAELELGAMTDTLDATGAIVAEDREAAARVDEAALRAAAARFVGPQEQVPPMYSAIRVGRKRLHRLARAGEVVEREPRPITIHRLEVLSFAPPRARLAIECSKGTYVRSLVDDLGRALGCGAHLTALRRTRSGAFGLDRAVPLDAVTPEVAAAAIVRPADALALPRVRVPEDLRPAVRNAIGAKIAPLLPEHVRSQLVDDSGELLAVVRREGDRVAFERVFVGT